MKELTIEIRTLEGQEDHVFSWDEKDVLAVAGELDRLRNETVGIVALYGLTALDETGRRVIITRDGSGQTVEADGTKTPFPRPEGPDLAERLAARCRENPHDHEIPVMWPTMPDDDEAVSRIQASGGYLTVAKPGMDLSGFQAAVERHGLPVSPETLLWDCADMSGLTEKISAIEAAGGRPNMLDLPGYQTTMDRFVLAMDVSGRCLVSPDAPGIVPKVVMDALRLDSLLGRRGRVVRRETLPDSVECARLLKDEEASDMNGICPFCGAETSVTAGYRDGRPAVLSMEKGCDHADGSVTACPGGNYAIILFRR